MPFRGTESESDPPSIEKLSKNKTGAFGHKNGEISFRLCGVLERVFGNCALAATEAITL
jgi:hypothetical protein